MGEKWSNGVMHDIQQIRRLNTARIVQDVFQGVKSRLAEKLNVQPSYITRITEANASGARAIGDDLARRIEEASGKPRNWLDQSHGAIVTETIGDAAKIGDALVGNVTHALPTRGRVPVVSWVNAGSWAAIDDHFLPEEEYEWLDTTEKLTEREAIALMVDGDSMYKPDDPKSFPPGCFIVVKRADLREPRSGDFVVVRLEDEQRSTFKQLMYDGDRMYLKALNPAYPTIKVESRATIVGVVVEKILRTHY